ncbi:MAG TPA: SCP2 sterol-binding domain-containing protein [Bellilinea sp.]
MTDLNIQSLMILLPEIFLPDQARGVSAVINFDLSGEGGGEWTVTIRDQKCTAEAGKAAAPDLSLSAKAKDILDIFTGRLDPTRALLFGKLRMTGDMRLAMRLAELFDTHDPRLRQWKA